jgi:hypothetical protein
VLRVARLLPFLFGLLRGVTGGCSRLRCCVIALCANAKELLEQIHAQPPLFRTMWVVQCNEPRR